MIIKNKNNFNNIDVRLGLKEIPSKEIKFLYENNSWDGPLEGICTWVKEKYYFLCFDQLDKTGEDRIPRKYILIRLTEEQYKEEEKEYHFFISLVSKEGLDKFFEEQKKFPQYQIETNQIIGWFQSSNPSSLIQKNL